MSRKPVRLIASVVGTLVALTAASLWAWNNWPSLGRYRERLNRNELRATIEQYLSGRTSLDSATALLSQGMRREIQLGWATVDTAIRANTVTSWTDTVTSWSNRLAPQGYSPRDARIAWLVERSLARAQSGRRLPFAYLQLGSIAALTDSTKPLTAVAQRLGRSPLQHAGHGHDGFTYLCYRGGRSGEEFSLILQSDDEMGGVDTHDVTSFVLAFRGSEPHLEGRCAPLRSEDQPVVTDRGVRLDLTRPEVERLLGQPTRDSAGIAIYEVNEKRPDRRGTVPDEVHGVCGPSYDAWSDLRLRYTRDRVIWIGGSRQDFC